MNRFPIAPALIAPRLIASALLATALLALAACGKSAPESAAGTATTANAAGAPSGTATVNAAAAGIVDAQPPPLELGDFKIANVLMGNAVDPEHVVIHDTRAFAAKDPIYASVLSVGAHQGLKLSAEWFGPDGTPIAKSEQPIVPASDLATTFNVSNPNGWPVGEYELRVAINGQAQRTEKFTVR